MKGPSNSAVKNVKLFSRWVEKPRVCLFCIYLIVFHILLMLWMTLYKSSMVFLKKGFNCLFDRATAMSWSHPGGSLRDDYSEYNCLCTFTLILHVQHY